MRSSSEVGPKRAPLAARTNDLPAHRTNKKMMSHQESSASASKLPSHAFYQQNVINESQSRKQSTMITSAKKKGVRFGLMEESENTGNRHRVTAVSTTQSKRPPTSTPIGLRSLRASLRESLSPRPRASRSQTPAATRMTVMTPRSMLSNEMGEMDDSGEESPLYSPAPPKQQLTMNTINQRPPSTHLDLPSESQSELETRLLAVNQKPGTSLQTTCKLEPNTTVKLAILHSRLHVATSAIAALHAPEASHSPLSGTSAVCMDLSSMFHNAASTEKKPMLSSRAPGSKRSVTKTASIQQAESIQKSTPAKTMKKNPRLSLVGLPRAAPSTTEDEDHSWAEKQCETFTSWLNFTIKPHDEDDEIIAAADETERAALRSLIMHQHLAKARHKALAVYTSAEMKRAKSAIDTEIASGKLALRKDKDLHADLTLRNQAVDLLLSYSTPYLRVCLEVMFGAIIDTQSSTIQVPGVVTKTANGKMTAKPKTPVSRAKLALKQFIISHVLSDAKILAKYTKKNCKVPSGRFGIEYQEEMRVVILRRLIGLFFFLDKCKHANIIDKAPKLFEDSARNKSSRDVLLTFCREFLSAEGNFVKHLARIGLKVAYVQNPIDELDFSVTNLATDLRDGVKLARMAEILKGESRTTILSLLRLPAVSRLQKLHNVGLVLKILRELGVPVADDIAAHHVVDGHREMVLKLMWSVLAHCCLTNLIDMEAVIRETARIERINASRHIVTSDLENDETFCHVENEELHQLQQVLLRWARAVCARYRVDVNHISRDFADGKAFCFLIHHYHPTILRKEEIRETSRDRSRTMGDAMESTLANERFNGSMANSRLIELGGIPKMVPTCDTSSLPNAKSMVLCLAFMFSRLLESNGEVRAAVTIQRRFRIYRRLIEAERKQAAASLILAKWRERKFRYYLNRKRKYQSAVRTIEIFMLAHKVDIKRLEKNRIILLRSKKAACKIQTQTRRYFAQRQYGLLLQEWRAAIVCQKQCRCWVLRRHYQKIVTQKQAARKIHCAWRKYKAHALVCNESAKQIQRVFRGYRMRFQHYIDVLDITCVQSLFRRRHAMKERQKRMRSVYVVQSAVKTFIHRKCFRDCRKQRLAAVTCQSVARTFLARQLASDLRTQRTAASTIQSLVRMFLVQSHLRVMHKASVVIQSSLLRYKAERSFVMTMKCIKQIQAVWKTAAARKGFSDCRSRAVICQKYARRWLVIGIVARRWHAVGVIQCIGRICLAKRQLKLLQNERASRTLAATNIQRIWRGFNAVIAFRIDWADVVAVQSLCRGVMARKATDLRVQALQTLQCQARCFLAQKKLITFKKQRAAEEYHQNSSALVLQSIYRGYLVRRELGSLNICAVQIQRIFRGFLASIEFQMDKADIILLQCVVRRKFACREAKERRHAVVRVQAYTRRALATRKVTRIRYARAMILNMESAARKIQKTWRCYTVHVDFMLSILACIDIQSCVRRYLAILESERRVTAVYTLQSFARTSVRKIRAATTIQCLARGYFTRVTLRFENFAAAEVQRIWRGYADYSAFAVLRRSATQIQAVMRGALAKNHIDRLVTEHNVRYILRRRCATSIQRRFRLYVVYKKELVAVTVIQEAARSFLAKHTFSRLLRGTVRLQCIVRAVQVRNRRNRQLKKLAAKLEEANTKAKRDPSLRLDNRCSAALRALKSSRLSQVMSAICTLEMATRLSEVCCKSFANAGAVDIIFRLIGTCNRSIPHVELLHLMMQTMSNVAKYDFLVPSFATPLAVDTLLDLIHMFRDKDFIFTPGAVLLERIVCIDRDLLLICKSKENDKRMKGLVALYVGKTHVTSHHGHTTSRRRSTRSSLRQVNDPAKGIRSLKRILGAAT